MTNLFNIFLIGCVPARIGLSSLIMLPSDNYMNIWIIPSTILILLFINRIVDYNTLKKNNIQQTGAFGQVFNYNYTRFFHILMIIIFISLITLKKYNCAKIIPLIDLLSGIIFVLHNHKYI